MSAAAYRSTQSSRSFTRQPLQKPSAMTNDCTRFRPPAPPASIVVPNLGLKRPSNEDLPNGAPSQPYTFSNPPRETQRQSVQNMRQLRHTHLRHRVSSAPDENASQTSARSTIKQHKPSSANEASTPRAYDEPVIPPLPLPRSVRRDEQQKTSLNALLKEQERSKVPKAVQNRRIILLFRRVPPGTSPTASPRQGHHATSGTTDIIAEDVPPCVQKPSGGTPYPINQQTASSADSYSNDPFYGFEQAEIADSKQIAAILANMQSLDDWIPGDANDGTSPSHQPKAFDPTKYEYVAKNSLDTATFKLSPRTLKPAEELAARSRFSQHYRYEMLSSANAQVPPLMASIVAENSNSATLGTGSEKTYTLRLNPTATMRKQGARSQFDDMPSTMDGEEVQLCFDEILKCFYDPKTGAYYELSSHR